MDTIGLGKLILGSYEYTNATDRAYDLVLNLMKGMPNQIHTIDTAISYFNDESIKSLVHDHNLKVISKIAPQMSKFTDALIMDHIERLGGAKINLMLIHNNRAPWMKVARDLERLKSDGLLEEVGVSNFSIKDLESYYEEFGHYPAYNEFEINPLYTDHDLINYCKSKGIKIIAYCILGGKYKADYLIKLFTIAGLVNYAGHYADHIILRSDSSSHLSQLVNSYDPNYVPDPQYNLEKVMVPMNYLPQINMKLVGNVVCYQGNSRSAGTCTPMKSAIDKVVTYKDYKSEFLPALLDSIRGLEFITDIRVMLRYISSNYGYESSIHLEEFVKIGDKYVGVYIIDKNENLSKVYKPEEGHIIYFKEVEF